VKELRMVAKHADAVRSLRAIWVGVADGVVRFELFDAAHAGIDYW
jgi:hypothetical protein